MAKREISIRQGERVRIIRLLFDSIPQIVRFAAEPTDGQGAVGGTVEVAGSKWLFSKPVATRPLAAENAVEKGFWDTFYSIYVTPDRDVTIRFESKHFHIKYLVYALIGVVVLAAASVFAMALLRG